MAGSLLHHSITSLSRSNLSRPSTSTSFSLSPYYRPMKVVSVAQTENSYWDSIHSDIDSHLKKAIPIRHPITVFEPMHHLTFAPPKTTAAALCVAACELVGGSRHDAIEAASVIHLMNAAAYAHENLPLTDRVRPKPEIPHKFGPNIELLTGDGIMPFGLELLAQSVDPTRNNSDKILRVIVEITRAVGSQGVVDGQYKEVEFDQSESLPSRDTDWIEYVCKKKEGGLHECAAACGAILGGGTEEEIEKLRRYGLYVGMVQGILYGAGKNEGGKMKLAEKWRALALKELEYFDSQKVDQISRIVGSQLYV